MQIIAEPLPYAECLCVLYAVFLYNCCLIHSVCLSIHVSMSQYLYFYLVLLSHASRLSLYVSFSASLSLGVSLYISVCFCLIMFLGDCQSESVFTFLFLSLFLSISLCFSLTLSFSLPLLLTFSMSYCVSTVLYPILVSPQIETNPRYWTPRTQTKKYGFIYRTPTDSVRQPNRRTTSVEWKWQAWFCGLPHKKRSSVRTLASIDLQNQSAFKWVDMVGVAIKGAVVGYAICMLSLSVTSGSLLKIKLSSLPTLIHLVIPPFPSERHPP